MIAAADRLRVISRNGVGTDNLPMPALARRGIVVRTAEAMNAAGVAELAIALMLSALRHIPPTDRGIKAGQWPRRRGMEIRNRRVGVVGCGAIGGEVARLVAAFGASVLAFDPARPALPIPPDRLRFVDLPALFSEAEIVTLHCPPAKDGRPLFDAGALAMLAPGAILVNTARAALVDEGALIAALDAGQVSVYAADVFAEEPPLSLALAGHSKVIATSHIGGFTEESVDRATEIGRRQPSRKPRGQVMATLVATPFAEGLAERLRAPRTTGVTLYWLGQAGFVVDACGYRVLIDPYLSDTLATKYAETPYPHERMMAAPLSVGDLGRVDLVLVTHHHTDHMDPGTLAPLAQLHPELTFVVPRAALAQARERIGVAEDRIRPLDAGDTIEPLPGVLVRAVRAAHETLERDEAGHHRFLGYGLSVDGVTLLHSGDTIPFEGQREEIAGVGADLALLPVNGRSDELRQAGFAGNLTIDEAIALCRACGIGALIAHHYGMFAFNSADAGAIDEAAGAAPLTVERDKAADRVSCRAP